MTTEKQAEIIGKACRDNGLDGHITWIEGKKQAHTWAERIAYQYKGDGPLPVKNSYMYCDTLDVCFLFSASGTPCMAYAGFTTAGSSDSKGNLAKAFTTAEKVLDDMKALLEEE